MHTCIGVAQSAEVVESDGEVVEVVEVVEESVQDDGRL